MDRATIEAFLGGQHLLVLGINRGAREPFLAPVWFEYTGGRFLIWSDVPTAKTRLIDRNAAVTLSIHGETRPYQAVLVRGRAAVSIGRDEALIRRLARRYLGADAGDAYADAAISGDSARSQGTIEVTPTAWRAWDYGEDGNADRVAWIADGALR